MKIVYTLASMPHKIAIFSEQIEIFTVETDYEQNCGYPLKPISYLQLQDAFTDINYNSSVLMLNDKF